MSQASAAKAPQEGKRKDAPAEPAAPTKQSWASLLSSGTPPSTPASAPTATAPAPAKAQQQAAPAGPAPVNLSAPPVWPGAQKARSSEPAAPAAAAQPQQQQQQQQQPAAPAASTPPQPTAQSAAKQETSPRSARGAQKKPAAAAPAAPAQAATPAAAAAAPAQNGNAADKVPKRAHALCRMGEKCLRPDCRFPHPQGRLMDGTFQPSAAGATSGYGSSSPQQQESASTPAAPQSAGHESSSSLASPSAPTVPAEPLLAGPNAPDVRSAQLESPAQQGGLLPSNFGQHQQSPASMQSSFQAGASSRPDSLLDTPTFAPLPPHQVDPSIDPNARMQHFAHVPHQQPQQQPHSYHSPQTQYNPRGSRGQRGGYQGQQGGRGGMTNGPMALHDGALQADGRAHSPVLDQYQGGGRGYNPAFMYPPQGMGYVMPGAGYPPYPVGPEAFHYQQFYDPYAAPYPAYSQPEVAPQDPRGSIPCRFDTKCRRPDCFYFHANGRDIDGTSQFYPGGGRGSSQSFAAQNGPQGFHHGGRGGGGGGGGQSRHHAPPPLSVEGEAGGQFNEDEIDELNAAFDQMISREVLEIMSPQDRDEYLQYQSGMHSDSFTDDEEYDYPEHLQPEVNDDL